MPTISRFSAFCATGLLVAQFAMANPILTPRAGEAVAERLPKDIRRGTCASSNNPQNDEERAKLFNENGNGWELVDRYLDLNDGEGGDAKNWTQELHKALFPKDGPGDFECSDAKDKCVTAKDCTKFEEAGWPGLFYVFKSLEYLSEYLQVYYFKIEEMETQLDKDIENLVNLIGIDKEKAKNVGVGRILSSSMGVISGLTAHNAAISGSFGVSSALFGLFHERISGVKPEVEGVDAKDILKKMVTKYAGSMKRDVQVIKNAVFGYTTFWGGTSEKLGPDEFRDIPRDMQIKGGDPDGNADEWNHAITYVLGDGQWFVERPAAGLDEKFAELYQRIMQMLAVELIKYADGAVVVINEGDKDEESCNAQKNNVWDPHPDRNWCYGMMWLNDKYELQGGLNGGSEMLWMDYNRDDLKGLGMDKLETYRNVLDCWTSNGAKMGSPDPREMPEDGNIPRCFFPMEIKKGNWVDENDCWDGKTIILDQSFPNFPSNEQGRFAWPQQMTTNLGMC